MLQPEGFEEGEGMVCRLKRAIYGLKHNLWVKDLGHLHYCLGIRITRDRKEKKLWMDQSKYIDDIMKRFKMDESKPLSTPMEGVHLSWDMCPADDEQREVMKQIPYRNLIGSLMYAMVATRPDIAVTVSRLSQFLSNPGMEHWQAAKRVVRYLKGMSDYGIMYTGEDTTITGFMDADWGGDRDTCRSTSGYTFLM